MLLAGVLTLVWAILIVAIVQQLVGLWTDTMVFTLTGLGVATLGFLFFRSLTRRYRKRFRARQAAFPPAWHIPLQKATGATPEEVEILHKQVQQFLAEKAQTAPGQKPDEKLRVAVAAGMRWPIRHFPYWDYPTLLEVTWSPFSFVEEPDKHRQLQNLLEERLNETPAISALAVSIPDVQGLLGGSLDPQAWAKKTFDLDIELPKSIQSAPLQLMALAYMQNVIHHGQSSGQLRLEGFYPTWEALLTAADQGFYWSEKALKTHEPKLYEALGLVFQSGKSIKWKRAMADLAWQRVPILGPNAPQVSELT